jgi:hypothetical protein
MFFILIEHQTIYQNFLDTPLSFIWFGGKVGTMLFLVISSYFMCQKKFKLKHLVFTILEMIIIKMFITLVIYFLGENSHGLKHAIFSVFDIYADGAFFLMLYVNFYMLLPLRQIIIKNIKERHILLIIIIGYFLRSFLPYFGVWQQQYVDCLTNSEIAFFTGAYIKLYPKRFFKYNLLNLSAAIFLIMLRGNLCMKVENFAVNGVDLTTMLITIFCVFVFSNLNFYSKTVNILARPTLSVYMTHMSVYSLLVLPNLVNSMVTNLGLYKIPIVSILFGCTFLYGLGAVIGLAYDFGIEHFLRKSFGKKLDTFQSKVENYLNKN